MSQLLEMAPTSRATNAVDEEIGTSSTTHPKTTPKSEQPIIEQYSVFSHGTRIYLTYSLGILMILSTLTATIYFPLIPLLSTQFHVSVQAINLTVTAYAICQAITPGIFASLADSYGRRPVLLTLVFIYVLGSLGLVLNKRSYAALLAFRVVQSLGGSAITPIGYGIVADVTVVSDRGRMLGPMLATCNGISAIGPVIGGAVALKTGGHTWVFLALLAIAAICFLAVGFTIPETARAIAGNGSKQVSGIWRTWSDCLARKKKSRGVQSEKMVPRTGLKESLLRTLDSLRIVFHPDAAAILWMVASSYGIYYTFQVAIPVIFDEIYHYNELQIGFAFLPGLAGMTLGGMAAGKLIDRNFAREAKRQNLEYVHDLSSFPIERARYKTIIPFVALETALVAGYGWAVHHSVHPAVPIVLQFFICALSTMLSHTASALLVDVFPDVPSTAYASGQLARCGFSAASAAIIEPLTKAVGRGWYFTIFAGVTGVGCLACVGLSRWKGMEWRARRVAL